MWDIIHKQVGKYVKHFYLNDEAVEADKYLKSWYEDLKKFIPNKQIQDYTHSLSLESLSRLLSLSIYTNAVEHHNVGVLIYNFLPQVNKIPSQVRKDRKNPSIGVWESIVDLLFLTQPSSVFTMADEDFSEFVSDSEGKLIRHELCCELLRYQCSLEISESITPSTIQPVKLQPSVNA